MFDNNNLKLINDIYKKDKGCCFVFVPKMSGRMQAYDFDDVISGLFGKV